MPFKSLNYQLSNLFEKNSIIFFQIMSSKNKQIKSRIESFFLRILIFAICINLSISIPIVQNMNSNTNSQSDIDRPVDKQFLFTVNDLNKFIKNIIQEFDKDCKFSTINLFKPFKKKFRN